VTEPTRLVSTPESELERALLAAGRSYGASSSVRANTLLALGLTAVATTVAPSAAAASSSLSKAALSKVALAVLALGVAVPAYRYFNRTNGAPVASVARPSAVGTASVLPLPSAAIEPAAAAPAAPVEATPVEAARVEATRVEAAEPPASTPARSSSNARAESKPASDPPLTAELAALDAARSSLSHSDPSAALSALDGYARNFPRGRLKIEAEVLRIGALSKSGQTEAARKRAQTFLRLHPDSVLASRVRSYAGL
jgi:hypothetical protein